MYPDKLVLDFFQLEGEVLQLPGGEGRTFKVGDAILKHINNDSRQSTEWLMKLSEQTEEDGFRLSKPIRSIIGTYISDFGWTAWTYIPGDHNYSDKINESIDGIISFHKAVKNVPRPPFVLQEQNPYRRADRMVWNEEKIKVDEELIIAPIVTQLLSRMSFVDLEVQMIHGDLNPANIILLDGVAPGIIDISPYWRPIEFALAVYAYWIGPFKDDFEVLKYFEDIEYFDQMMFRAALRMILIQQEFGRSESALKEIAVAEKILSHYK